MLTMHTIEVPRAIQGGFAPALRRRRRRALQAARALEALGERWIPCFVTSDGSPLPPDQVTEQDLADVRSDLEHLGTRDVPSLDVLIERLYQASSHPDRSLVGPALDRLLEYVDHWGAVSPAHLATLFSKLDPSRLVRAVGQTLLAATRVSAHDSPVRREFLSRFLDDLRNRGTPEEKVRRLQQGLEM